MLLCFFRKGILDNGGEFLDFDGLEKSIHKDINKRMKLYYTHNYAPYKKPHVETVLSADNILDIINRLNNYPRASKGYKISIQFLEEEYGSDILEILQLHHIPNKELNMKDMIIKNQLYNK